MKTISLKDLNLLDIGNTIQMSGAIYSGRDKAYIVLFPDEGDAANFPIEFLDMTVEDWVTFLRQTDLLEVQAADGSNEKALLRKSTRQIDTAVSWKVFKRDGYACRYCGNADVALTVDHLVRWEEGGPSIKENLAAACKKCNKTRGNLNFADWLKDPFYLKVSRNLKPEARAANEAVLGTLDAIPRKKHVGSR